eukprot:GHVU01125704.1.p1 GENE.GHVU01125704.1~~GHVU01125704.1.p1  ORF type:complete len:123 (+),score=5.20 GHVU01125704.1:115-483(+)
MAEIGLEIHHQLYRNQCHAMNKLLLKTRKEYYLAKITDCGRDQKGIYRITKHLLGTGTTITLPQHTSASELAERFREYFIQKIVLIRNSLQAIPVDQRITDECHYDSVCELSTLIAQTSHTE